MATNLDLRIWQKRELFRLFKLKYLNENEVIGLKEQILEAKAAMIEEDIAAVEKQIAELYA